MTINKKIIFGLLFAGLCITESCSENEDEKYTPSTYNVSGKVEKGPFISGSTIDLQPMDAKMQILGSTFSSTISNNSGHFTFGAKEFTTPFAQLTATGYFFNEVNGDLSTGTLTLRAIVNLASKSTVNVNILTHLKYQRILKLIADGQSFDKANSRAQEELLSAFGLQRFADTDVSQYSIASGTNEAGALIAISSLLLTNRTEAELTEYLAELSSEFGKNGTFPNEIKQQFKKDRNELSSRLPDIENNIISRYESLGTSVTVKDLSYFFDWNDDGIAGNEIVGNDNPVTLDKTELDVPQEGGEYSVRITSSVPVTLTPEASGDINQDIIEEQHLTLYESSAASHSSSIDNQTLKITVHPAIKRIILPTTIRIYDYRGYVVAALTIHQEGNPSGDLFTKDGSAVVLELASKLSKAIGLSNAMDARYTKLIQNNDFTAPVSPGNTNLNNCWSYFYDAINQNLAVAKVDENAGNFLQMSLNTLNALCYYHLVSYWGDIPYRTKENTGNFSLSRTPVNKVYELLETDLKNAINEFDEKKNIYATHAEDFIFFSKDVPRIILAQLYMYQDKYNEAKTLLQKIVSNGYYQLESNVDYSSTSRELILGLETVDGSRSASTITSVLTYTDVILSLAECELNLNNPAAARNYLEEVTHKKNITVSTEVKSGIKEARKKSLSECGGYFSFLKRNGIALPELNLQEYQLLLPIPDNEVIFNSAMTQNPGYK